MLPVVLVLAITCAAFARSLSNDFVNWDDNLFVYENPNVLSFTWVHLKAIFSTQFAGAYCPLVILSFALEKMAFGLNPGMFHLDNLLLHLVCVFLVYRLLQELDLSKWAAVCGALLFGIHPMHVESVAWITERKDVLYGAFYFGALLAYVRYTRVPARRKLYLLALALFSLSLLAKIQAVALPLSMLLIDYYFKRRGSLKLLEEKLPFFVLSVVVGIVGVLILAKTGTLNQSAHTTLLDRLLLGAYAFWVYLVKAVVPYELSAVYVHPAVLTPIFYMPLLATLALACWLWRQYRCDHRAIVFGFLYFTANIVFVLQVLAAGQGFLADRYTYVAYFGLFFLAATAFDSAFRVPTRRPYMIAVAIIYMVALGGITWKQCGVWENGETLWTDVMRHIPSNPLPYLQRGLYYRSVAETAPPDQAPSYYAKALADFDQAVRLIDSSPDAKAEKVTAHNDRAKTLFDMNRNEDAIADYTKVIGLDATYAQAYVNRAAAYAKTGQRELALADLNWALTLDPKNAGALYTRALLYLETKRYDLAVRDFDSYLQIQPDDADVRAARNQARLGLSKP
jgi:tetratricopeptide (TPR) repeat protein